MPNETPNPVMARTSSILAAAMTRVGMPLFRPNPLSARFNKDGTTTAGETAARTNLEVQAEYCYRYP